jgi:phosphomannomutase
VISDALRCQVEAWIREDPDAGDQAELRALLAAGGQEGEPGRTARAGLTDRFASRLQFGTAGLRGQVGAGPNRMNRAVVRAATAALAGWLHEYGPGAALVAGGALAADAGTGVLRPGQQKRRDEAPTLPSSDSTAGMAVVIGCDARHRSATFADEAAAVLTGAGIGVHLLPRPNPTPLLAFAIRHLSAVAGIMITASHNPAADNGYKLYLGDGAQIVPPVDAQIEAAIGGLGPLSQIPAGPLDGPLVTRHGDEVAQAYLDAIIAAMPSPAGPPSGGPRQPELGQPEASQPGTPGPPLRVVYTALHGVAASLALRAIDRAGFPAPYVVAAQAEPDPDFPTVAFPNPEEPGALDLALAQAREDSADLVLANDPDGDRLAVAAPDPAAPGAWRVLTGDQVGALIGSYLLERTAAEPEAGRRLVVTTVVSSTLLSKIAAAAGARYAETLTGFKWIVRAGPGVPGSRFLLGYEEALGYAVGDVVRDKDGISAALALLSLAVTARAAGQSLLDRWDVLEAGHGVHLTAQVTLHAASLAGEPVTGCHDLSAGPGEAGGADAGRPVGPRLPPADVLIYRLPGARVVIRPSGTEPKLKAYLEIVEPATAGTLAAARAAVAERLGPLRAAVADLVARG